jgi:hypothetical protein
MKATIEQGVSLYEELGLTTTTRKHPEALIRHASRLFLRRSGGMSLKTIQEVEYRVTGKSPHHSSIINSTNGDAEIDPDIWVDVMSTYVEIVRKDIESRWLKGNQKPVD